MDGQIFSQQAFDEDDPEGRRLLAELCGQRGINVIGIGRFGRIEDGKYYKYGDVILDLDGRYPDGRFQFGEAERRGRNGNWPWVEHTAEHPWRFKHLVGVSIIGRKLGSPALFQISFCGPNAIVALLRDARWQGVKRTTRGDDDWRVVALDKTVVFHSHPRGLWIPCPGICIATDCDSPKTESVRTIES